MNLNRKVFIPQSHMDFALRILNKEKEEGIDYALIERNEEQEKQKDNVILVTSDTEGFLKQCLNTTIRSTRTSSFNNNKR